MLLVVSSPLDSCLLIRSWSFPSFYFLSRKFGHSSYFLGIYSWAFPVTRLDLSHSLCLGTLRKPSKALTITWLKPDPQQGSVVGKKKKSGNRGIEKGVSKARKGKGRRVPKGKELMNNWLACTQASTTVWGLPTKQEFPILYQWLNSWKFLVKAA